MATAINTPQEPWKVIGSSVSGYVTTMANSEVSHQVNSGWLARIRQHVYDNHRDVESVYVSIGDDGFVHYWIVIPSRDIKLVGRLIKDQQTNIISLFAQTPNPPFSLDFHIIYREGQEVTNLVPSKSFKVPKF